MDIQRGTGLSVQNSHSLTSGDYKYTSLLSKHLSSSRRKSPTKSASSSISHRDLDCKSQSHESNHAPFNNADKCQVQGNCSVSKQVGLKSEPSLHPYYGSVPSKSHASPDLVPSQSLSQNQILPTSPRCEAIIFRMATIPSIVDGNPSSCTDSDEDSNEDNASPPHSSDSSDAEDSPNTLQPSQCVPLFPSSQNTANCSIHHHYVGSKDCSNIDNSNQEDFLQLGASNSTTYASIPHCNHLDVNKSIVSLHISAEPIATNFSANISKAQSSGNNSLESTNTKTGDISDPLLLAKRSNCNTANVGSLCGPGVPHADITKCTSSCSSLCQPVLFQSNRSPLMGRRIAAGLGSHQNTTGISDSSAISPSNGGVLHNSYEPLSLDPLGKNISEEYDSFMFPNCSNITEQGMSTSTRLPSEDVSSPFSLVNTDILAYKGNVVPLVDIHPAHCSMRK